MKKIILHILIVTTGLSAFSQDLHFSQFNENPSLINPALVGSQYVMRASVIYRDQWRSVTVPYKTFGASYEMKLKASSWDKVDDFKTKAYKKPFNRISAGLSFYSDKAGDANMKTNLVYFSLASFIKTSKYSALSVGLQGGVVQKSADYADLVFSNQYNGNGGYDPSIGSGEPAAQNVFYADYSAGVAWNYSQEKTSSVSETSEFNANFGVAMYHINTPNQSFFSGGDAPLYSKYVVHGKLVKGNATAGIAPSFLCQFQGPTKEIIAGAMVLKYMKINSKYTGNIHRTSIGLGAYYRYKDAVIIAAMANMGQYAIGLSYDINASGLATTAGFRGGPEIMLRYNSSNPFLFQKR